MIQAGHVLGHSDASAEQRPLVGETPRRNKRHASEESSSWGTSRAQARLMMHWKQLLGRQSVVARRAASPDTSPDPAGDTTNADGDSLTPGRTGWRWWSVGAPSRQRPGAAVAASTSGVRLVREKPRTAACSAAAQRQHTGWWDTQFVAPVGSAVTSCACRGVLSVDRSSVCGWERAFSFATFPVCPTEAGGMGFGRPRAL